jgi:hypothetical protein
MIICISLEGSISSSSSSFSTDEGFSKNGVPSIGAPRRRNKHLKRDAETIGRLHIDSDVFIPSTLNTGPTCRGEHDVTGRFFFAKSENFNRRSA